MANTLQPRARQGFANAELDWDSDTIKVVAVDAGYTYSSAHEDLADVGGAARVATSAALTGKTLAGGVLDADDATFTAPPSGDTITGFWVYQDTGVEGTSLLIYWIDTVNGVAVNVATNGGDIVLAWNASGIVRI